MTKLSETLCPKTGSNVSNYIQITFFTTKSIQTAKGHHRPECISNNLDHFAGIFRIFPKQLEDSIKNPCVYSTKGIVPLQLHNIALAELF
jgi:hypothetical protein